MSWRSCVLHRVLQSGNLCLRGVTRSLSTSNSLGHMMDARDKDHQTKEKQLVLRQEDFFDRLAKEKATRDKKTFLRALKIYEEKESVHRRGHVEFINAALNKMMEFGVNRDINVYRAVIDLFPKGKMIPETPWQVEFMHYPKQQDCCISILEQMEDNGVIPDDAMGYQLISIFGPKTHVFRKYRRMMYWLPKFRYANPYYIPWQLPDDRIEIAKIAVKRMCVDVDLLQQVKVFETKDVENSYDETFVVSSQSPEQRELLQAHPTDTPLYVEGGFDVWLRHLCMKYFILRSEVSQRLKTYGTKKKEEDENDTNFNWNFFQGDEPENKLSIPPSVHEQDDGTILGICITGTSSKDSLASWVKCLEKDNPTLGKTPVVFLLRTPEGGLQVFDGEKPLKEGVAFYDGS